MMREAFSFNGEVVVLSLVVFLSLKHLLLWSYQTILNIENLNQELVRTDTCSSHHLFVWFSFSSCTAKEVPSYTTTDGRSGNIQYILQCLKRFNNVFDAIGCYAE